MKETVKTSRTAGYLEKIFRALNVKYFNGELEEPIITIQSTPRAYGHVTVAKRRARMKISEQKRLSGQVSEAKADICPPEIEIKKEIDIEIEKERELKPGRAAPAAYGRYKNVILTDTELSELKAELPDKWEYYIDRLSGYIASTGRKYKNHAATIRRWAADDTAKAAPKKGIPDYSYKEGESL